MTKPHDEVELRAWLIDYLTTTVGLEFSDIDPDASLHDLGVGSRDAVVLSGVLAELLDRPVSPVDFWQHPTVNSLAAFLTSAEPDSLEIADSVRGASDQLIAVTGLGCRFPGDITGPDTYWEFLRAGRSAVSEVCPQRWALFDDGSPEVAAALARTTRWGAFLSGVEEFDAEYFEISPAEAEKMDPQQRLLLEVTHEALEHAGITADSLRRTQTGVFVGACAGEYGYLNGGDLSQVDAFSGTGGALSIIANRVSYFFDLRGPSVTVDTACSSSLVAIHLACQSLRSGDTDLALAAGVNLMLSPSVTHSFDAAEAMSPTGQCHAFDAAADGFVRGEGAGVVVLQRLSDALTEGNRVLAVIRGSAVNQDGRSNGLMAPNPSAQMAVLRGAYANAAVAPQDVDYVETHGTGTLLGDPIEARALGTVLGRARPATAPLLIGAVKSNLGHLEAAAGVAGFIKAVLAIQQARIPANRDFATPNPLIPFEKLRLRVVAEHTDWPVVDRPRRAGVSSFGFGGTNAHVVLEQAPVMSAAEPVIEPAVTTLVVSGKTAARVAASAGVLKSWLADADESVSVAAVAHTLNHHRARFPKFGTVVARDRGQAVAGLAALAGGYSAPGAVGVHDGVCRPGTVFVYSGQGSQWAGMGQRLLVEEPAFAAAVAELESDFVAAVGFSLHDVLTGGRQLVGIDRIQPVLTGVQLALTALWRAYGVTPDAVIGHSMGEVAAAVVAGALSPVDGLKVIATRSRLMARLSGQGAMALIELDAAAAKGLLGEFPDVCVAVYASPRQTVIAGPPEQVDAVVAVVEGRDLLARRVEVDVASHSPIVDPILAELAAALQGLSPVPPSIPVLSTVEHDGSAFDAAYWVANLRSPVRFSQAVVAAGAEHGMFVEVSPHPVLTHSIGEALGEVHHHAVGTLARDTDETVTFHTNVNATHTLSPPLTEHPDEPHPPIPNTPWLHQPHWITPRKRMAGAGAAPRFGTLLGPRIAVATNPPTRLWQARLVPEAKPYPGFHQIQGIEVVPASVLLATVLAAAAECGSAALGEIRFENPVVVDQPRIVQVLIDPADPGEVIIFSKPAEADAEQRWVRHVTAHLVDVRDDPADSVAARWIEQVVLPLDSSDPVQPIAEILNTWGVAGQPFDWTITTLHHDETATSAQVLATPGAPDSTAALLDAAVCIARLADRSDTRLMVPAAVQRVRIVTEPTTPEGIVHVRRRVNTGVDELVVDVAVYSPVGELRLQLEGLRYASVESPASEVTVDGYSLARVIEWTPWQPGSDTTTEPGTFAVIGKSAAAAADLGSALTSAGHTAANAAATRYLIYLAEPDLDDPDLDAAVRMATEVTGLVRTLAQRDPQHPVRLWVVTRGVHQAETVTAPAQSSLWGLGPVIAAEQPDVWGGVLDAPGNANFAEVGAVLAGILDTSHTSVLMLRDGQLFTPQLVPATGTPVREPLRCRPDGAYLVTGGLGALGLLMAAWLVDRGARRLLLVGRTALPARRDWDNAEADAGVRDKIVAIRELERRGVSVEALPVDVGVPQAITGLLAERDRAGAPPIRGVIHAAGVTDNTLLTETSESIVRAVMWPKIAGSQALHRAFAPGNLDFLYLIGSAGSVFGIPGQGAYAAANAYLDCLARLRRQRGCHTLSLDWVAWRDIGFAAEAPLVVAELERRGSRPIRPDEAFAAWEFIDRYDVAQAVMVPLPASPPPAPATPARDWSQLDRAELLLELEEALRAILARELRLPETELQSDRPFAELGINSVMAMSIRREAERLVGIELSATMLWNHPTVTSLARHLAAKLAPHHDSEENDNLPESSGSSVLDALFDSVESS